LSPSIERLLTEAHLNFSDLRALAVNIGPSPYTGLRVGITAVKTMQLTLGIPAFGVSCLAVETELGKQAFNQSADQALVSSTDSAPSPVLPSVLPSVSSTDSESTPVSRSVSSTDSAPSPVLPPVSPSVSTAVSRSRFRADILVVEDSRRRQVYYSFNDSPPQIDFPESVIQTVLRHRSKSRAQLRPLVIIGNALARYQSVWETLRPDYMWPSHLDQPTSALQYVRAAQKNPNRNLTPWYLRRPDVFPPSRPHSVSRKT
jgi:tRNA threonylcarbamoyl adenosine modification protein YeaZ